MPLSGKAVLGMAAATGELQLYTLSDSQVRNVASEAKHCEGPPRFPKTPVIS